MMKVVGPVLAMIALGIGCISVAMTFRYGLVFADEGDRYVFAGLFAAADAVKLLLPTLAAALAFKGLKGASFSARFIYVIFAALSLSCHVGLVLTVKERETSGANVSQARYQDAAETKRAIQDEIATLKTTRPLGKIESDIERAERDPIFTDEKRSNRCANDTAAESRKLCDAWRGFKGERKDRERLDTLRADLAKAEEKVGGLLSVDAVKTANVMVAKISAATGLSPDMVLFIIAGVMALVIELGSSILLELVAKAGHMPEARQANLPVFPDPAPIIAPIDAITPDNAAAMVPEPSLPQLCPKQWVASRMQPKRSASLPLDTTYELYAEEAAAASMAAATTNAFSRALTANGYERKRPGGKTMIMAASLAIRGVKPALVAVR